MKPTFVGLGGQKCASTWAYRVVAAHPQICVPETKEIHFFSRYFARGYGWYEGHFAGGEHALAAGEVSTSYLYDLQAPGRLRAYRPGAKLIVTLRNPVQRALSNHGHEVREGHVRGDLSFETALAANPMYIEQGLYAKYLRAWLAEFPRDQLFVAFSEDIERDPRSVAQNLYSFLGVDPDSPFELLDRHFNRGYVHRSRAWADAKEQIYAGTRGSGFGWIWSLATALGGRALYRRFNVQESNAIIPPPRRETLIALHESFETDVIELETLLGRDLSDWRTPTASAHGVSAG